jgi:hypothetical protein
MMKRDIRERWNRRRKKKKKKIINLRDGIERVNMDVRGGKRKRNKLSAMQYHDTLQLLTML